MKIKKYLLLLLALLMASINLNLILKPLDLVTGGTQGVAILFNHILKISPALIILIVNIAGLIISYLVLPKETTYGTIIATFIYPLFVKLTSFLPSLNLNDNYTIFLVVIAGIVCGITGGMVYKLGFSNGGISVIALVVKKYFKVEVAVTNFIVNGIIVLLGLYYFGFIKCLYALLVIFLQSLLIRLILRKKFFSKR